MMKTSSEDRILAALEEISSAIKHPQLQTPFLNGDTANNIIQELTKTFQTEAALPRVLVKTTIRATPNGSPRVQNKQQPSKSTAPRVPIKKLFVPHQLGMIIYKQFKNKNYQGIIVQHDARKKLYKILNEDGDAEEMSHGEVIKYTKAPIKILSTRFQRIEHEYWTAQQSGRCRSPRIKKLQVPFTGGFANVAKHLQSTWYHHNDWIPQEYKIYVNSVLDKETGRKLEYLHLIKHPKFKDVLTKSGANKSGRL